MNSLRNLVAMLGGLAGTIGFAMAVFVLDMLAMPTEITAATVPADGPWDLALAGSALCGLGALAIWRAPILACFALTVGTVGLVQGLGYTPFTLLPIGFAATAAALAVVVAINRAG